MIRLIRRLGLHRQSSATLWALVALLLLVESSLLYAGWLALSPPQVRTATLQPTVSAPDPSGEASPDEGSSATWEWPEDRTPPAPGPLVQDGQLADLARAFDAELALEHVAVLASQEFGGRQPGTIGHTLAGEYIADRFAEYGLLPVGTEGYYQPFMVPYARVTSEPTLVVADATATPVGDLAFRQDYAYAWGGYAGGGSAQGNVYWLGDGEQEDYRGQDVSGGIVFCRFSDKPEVYRQALEHGASGLILLTQDEGRITRLRTYREVPYLPKSLPTLIVNDRVAEALLAGSGYTAQDLSILCEALPLLTTAAFEIEMEEPGEAEARNILGILPGSDADLTGQILILGAHYDHLGTDGNGDIYNGANDDASGVAVLLEIARSWQEAGFTPRVSVLFAAWDSEEQGLLGAVHYVSHPALPLQHTLGMIQLDMVGLATDGVMTIDGDTDIVGQQLAASADLFAIETQGPGRGAQLGSDHLPFARSGVPAALLIWDSADVLSGQLPYYHTPEDTLETLQPERLHQTGAMTSHAAMMLSTTQFDLRDLSNQLTSAISARDVSAYSALLDPTDALLVSDGEQWLASRPAQVLGSFTSTIDSLVVWDNVATCQITARTLDGDGPGDTLAKYPLNIVRRGADWYVASPIGGEIETSHTIVRVVANRLPADGDTGLSQNLENAGQWAQAFDTIYARVSDSLDHTSTMSTTLTIYPNQAAQRWLVTGDGWSDESSIPADEIASTAPMTPTAVALVLQEMGLPTGQGQWLRDGVTSLLSETSPLLESQALTPVAGLAKDAAARDTMTSRVLSIEDQVVATSLARHLLAKHGLSGLAGLCSAWGTSGTIDGAFASLGTTPDGFVQSWEQTVTSPLSAASAGVQQTLDTRRDALLAGTEDAFLADLTSDPLLVAEQSQWFRAVRARGIKEYALEAEILALGSDSAQVRVYETLQYADGTTNRSSQISRFVRAGNRWLHAGRAWESAQTGYAIIRHEGLDAATVRTLSQAINTAYMQVTTDLGALPPLPLEVWLYEDRADLAYSIGSATTAGTMSWYGPGQPIKLVRTPDGQDYVGILSEELARGVLYEMGLREPWVREGIALLERARSDTHEKSTLTAQYAPTVREAARLGRLYNVDLPAMPLEKDAQTLWRGQAWLFWDSIARGYGMQSVRVLLRDLASGESLATAFAGQTETPLAIWEEGWRALMAVGGAREEQIAVATAFDADAAQQTIVALTSPQYAGRQTGSPEAASVAGWLADEFASTGLEPAFPDIGYLQPVSVTYASLTDMPGLVFSNPDSGETLNLAYGESFQEVRGGLSGAGSVVSDLVWLPGGYEEGQQFGGRIVMQKSEGDVAEDIQAAVTHGAGGLILVRHSANVRTRPLPMPSTSDQAIPAVEISETTWRDIAALAGLTTQEMLSAAPVTILPLEASLAVPYTIFPDATAYTVAGLLLGTRPDLGTLVVAAHYDGVGALPDGTLYPGANANASGVAVMLETARVLAGSNIRPARSILFVALGAEEDNLASTRAYLESPPVPLQRTDSVFVLDGVGRARSYYLTFDGDATREGEILYRLLLAGDVADRRVSKGLAEQGGTQDIFRDADVPTVLLFWPSASDVHRLGDTAEAIDPWKLETTGIVLTLTLLMAE